VDAHTSEVAPKLRGKVVLKCELPLRARFPGSFAGKRSRNDNVSSRRDTTSVAIVGRDTTSLDEPADDRTNFTCNPKRRTSLVWWCRAPNCAPYCSRRNFSCVSAHRTSLRSAPYHAAIPVCRPMVNIPWSGIANTIANLRLLRFSRNLRCAGPRSGVYHDKRAQPFVIIY
jgi:hypothetical protein